MGTARLIIGDSLTALKTLPDASVDLVMTSPPFLALRSYLPADHPDKGLEMGSEATPGEFIDALVLIVEECRRVLAPHGSICFELGDTYSGSGGGGGDYLEGGLREGQPGFGGSAAKQRDGNAAHWRLKNAEREAWPLDKSLCLIPELFRITLVYGRNPLTGRTTPPWRARNVIRWCRPNPPVGALADKVRPATSDMLVACVGRKRYFDLDSVRGEHKPHGGETPGISSVDGGSHLGKRFDGRSENQAGAPPLDHWWHDDTFDQDAWNIPTHGYPGSHYATFPEALCVKPIEMMCPRRVCLTCGKPSERIVDITRLNPADDGQRKTKAGDYRLNAHDHAPEIGWEMAHTTLGWTDCGHNTWRNGLVLDPFAGSGTVLAVAVGHGRDAIGVDLDARNADLAQRRCGMFLTVDTPHKAA